MTSGVWHADSHGQQQAFNYSTATIPEVITAFVAGADANVEMTYDFVQFAKVSLLAECSALSFQGS